MADVVIRLGARCDLVREDRQGLSFDVSEWIELADGRRVTLHTERGFGIGIAAGYTGDRPEPRSDRWSHMSRNSLEADGIEVTPACLQALPYVVEFSARVLGRLRP